MPHQCLGCGRSFAEGSTELLRGCPGCQGTRFFYTAAPLDATGLAAKRGEAEKDLRAIAAAGDAELWTWAKRDEWVRGARGGAVGFDSRKVSDTLSLFSEHRARATERGALIIAPSAPAPTVAEFVGGRLERGASEPAPAPEPAPAKAAPAEAAADAPEPAAVAEAREPQAAAPPTAQAPAVERPDTVAPDVGAAAVEATSDAPKSPERVASVVVDRPGTYEIDVKGLLDANPVVIEKDGVYMIHLPSVFESAEKRR